MLVFSRALVADLEGRAAVLCMFTMAVSLPLSPLLSPPLSHPLDLPTGWEEGYTFEGARCFIK